MTQDSNEHSKIKFLRIFMYYVYFNYSLLFPTRYQVRYINRKILLTLNIQEVRCGLTSLGIIFTDLAENSI